MEGNQNKPSELFEILENYANKNKGVGMFLIFVSEENEQINIRNINMGLYDEEILEYLEIAKNDTLQHIKDNLPKN